MITRNHAAALLLALGLCAGCAAETSVMPVNSSENRMNDICIKLNPKITTPEFTYILEEGFSRHGINSKIKKTVTADCEYSLIYTANIDHPDTKPIINDVHLAIYRGTQLIGYADRDRPKGLLQGAGVEITHWDTTRDKIEPMLNELLEGFSPVALATPTSTLFKLPADPEPIPPPAPISVAHPPAMPVMPPVQPVTVVPNSQSSGPVPITP